MTEVAPSFTGDDSGILYIHFDVTDHHLNLDTFIRTADSARKVVEALDSTFFKNAFGLTIIVLPPADGSFITRLGVLLGGAGTLIFGLAQLVETAISVVESDSGGAFIESFTGKAPEDWARDLGEAQRKAHEENSTIGSKLKPSKDTQADSATSEDVSRVGASSAICRPVLQLVTTMTRGILEMETDALARIEMDIGKLPDALNARAEFFEACYNDPGVKRIGFTPDDDFPIPRNSFPERAQKPARKKKEEDEPEWVVATEDVSVTSPNWDRRDQITRGWKGKDAKGRNCFFVIEDEEFWLRVRMKELPVDVVDNLQVQWAYQLENGVEKNRRVLRVIRFNDQTLAEPLSSDALAARLGAYSTGKPKEEKEPRLI